MRCTVLTFVKDVNDFQIYQAFLFPTIIIDLWFIVKINSNYWKKKRLLEFKVYWCLFRSDFSLIYKTLVLKSLKKKHNLFIHSMINYLLMVKLAASANMSVILRNVFIFDEFSIVWLEDFSKFWVETLKVSMISVKKCIRKNYFSGAENACRTAGSTPLWFYKNEAA